MALLWALSLAMQVPAAAPPMARDHGHNQIETFWQVGPFGDNDGTIRACTLDRTLCAELVGRLSEGVTLRIEEQAGAFAARTRTRDIPLARELLTRGGATGYTIGDFVIREPRGAIMIALDLSRETGTRLTQWSYQRRLLLLRIAAEEEAVPAPLLDAPLSGVAYATVCPIPPIEWVTPPVEPDGFGVPSDDWSNRVSACQDHFVLRTRFTLLPSIGPVEPPNLIMVVTAETSPGRRTRADGPVPREPIVRNGENDVRDPDCTYTRSFYFNETLSRYEPDAPLPPCRDYLEP